MGKQNKKWDAASIQAEASAYTNVADFRAGSPKAYSAAHRHDVFKTVTAHMTNDARVWSVEEVTRVAKGYKTRGEFSKGSAGGYTYARRQGILDEICAHMPANVTQANAKWTATALATEAAKFSTKSEFRTGSRSAYVTASKMGILADLFEEA